MKFRGIRFRFYLGHKVQPLCLNGSQGELITCQTCSVILKPALRWVTLIKLLVVTDYLGPQEKEDCFLFYVSEWKTDLNAVKGKGFRSQSNMGEESNQVQVNCIVKKYRPLKCTTIKSSHAPETLDKTYFSHQCSSRYFQIKKKKTLHLSVTSWHFVFCQRIANNEINTLQIVFAFSLWCTTGFEERLTVSLWTRLWNQEMKDGCIWLDKWPEFTRVKVSFILIYS